MGLSPEEVGLAVAGAAVTAWVLGWAIGKTYITVVRLSEMIL